MDQGQALGTASTVHAIDEADHRPDDPQLDFLTMVERIRHQLFLPKSVSERLEMLAAKPGALKSAILADAVTAWLNRRGASELEDRFGIRLDRLTAAIGRLERDGHIEIETLALFVRYELAIHAPLAANDHAGRALAAKRFEAFIAQVGRQIAAGRRTLADGIGGKMQSGQ